jgi:hypothetical protein
MAEIFCSKPGTDRTLASHLFVNEEDDMGFGRGALLWLIGVPLPIILLLAVFMHH